MALSPDFIDLPPALGNGTTTAFAIGATPENAAWLAVSVGSVLQMPPAYSVSGSTVTFAEAPPAGVPVTFRLAMLNTSGVTAGTYNGGGPITVDAYGRVTAITNGTSTGTPEFQTIQAFTYTGADQIFSVPSGVGRIKVTMWGAGGAGGTAGTGGAGGLTQGIVTVTPGDTVKVIVGSGGALSVTRGLTPVYNFGGGAEGASIYGNRLAGAGGGRSAIRLNNGSDDVMTAGAGGGGAGDTGGTPNGGAGGGLTGSSSSGQGGSQTAGGASGPNSYFTGMSGARYLGGFSVNPSVNSSSAYGAGGGSGYYGGGAGGAWTGGGGGGSGYAAHAAVTGGTTVAGNGQTPPGTSDPAYQAGIARGGALAAAGGHGLVVIAY